MRTRQSRIVRAAATLTALAVLLAGCGSTDHPAPLGKAPASGSKRAASPASKPRVRGASPAFHVVRRGDTLFSIAWRYGKDYRSIARLNGIRAPYTIRPGQKVRLTPPPRRSGATAPRSATASKPAARPRASSTRAGAAAVKRWQWPTRGKIIGRYGRSGGKGINIAGRMGQGIVAAAPGKVVYSGSGLRGYGKLIIIKHNNRFLSAYAHNHRLHVKEGDTVQRGQRIAEMGRSGAKRVMLHFEIRRDGKPVDPARYLPG